MLQVTNVVEPDGTSVQTEFHSTGQVKLKKGSRTYPVGFAYDAQGRMAVMTNWTTFDTAGQRRTYWDYDAYTGLLAKRRHNDDNGPAYTYTAGGRSETRLWARGTNTTYAYNNAGELSSVTYNGPSATNVTYTYNRLGRLSQVVQGDITTDLTYNDNGQSTGESYTGGVLNGRGTTFGYDSYFRRTSVEVNGFGATSTSYSYDAASRMTNVVNGNYSAGYSYLANSPLVSQIMFKNNGASKMTTTKRHDRLNRLLEISSVPTGANENPIRYAYLYNDANERVRATLAGGSFWGYRYDTLGQVTSGKKYWDDATPVPGEQFEYGFDEIGNRTQTASGGDSSGANLRSSSYTLDNNSLNQYASRQVLGTIDVLGLALGTTTNVTVNGATPDYRRGEFFQKAVANDNSSSALYPSVTVLVNGGGTGNGSTGNVFIAKSPESFTYDADGNLASDGRWNYTWDAENRLLKLESVSGAPSGSKRKIEFGYDWIGRRIWKKVTNLDTSSTISEAKFLYDGWNLLAELDTSNNLIRSYVWGLDLSGSMQGAGGVGGLLVVKPASGNPQFVAYDGNGNVTALVDSGTGQSTAQYEYGPFGEPIRVSGAQAKANPFRWSTKYTDDESGLVYYTFRYYDPLTGRWISRDPIGEAGGANLYGFIDNRPTDRIDALGQKSPCHDAGKKTPCQEALENGLNYDGDGNPRGGNCSMQKWQKIPMCFPKPGDGQRRLSLYKVTRD